MIDLAFELRYGLKYIPKTKTYPSSCSLIVPASLVGDAAILSSSDMASGDCGRDAPFPDSTSSSGTEATFDDSMSSVG